MLNNEIKDFSYHEFKTDSDNFVRDLSRVFALGCYSKETRGADGNIIKPKLASIEYNWQIVYPAPNFNLIPGREVNSFDELDSNEYEVVTLDQISRITNKATIKCMTLSDDKTAISKKMGLQSAVNGTQKKFAEMYLQLYMPKYLCDTELIDPFVQEDGVSIPLCVNVRNGRVDAKVRNYHWCLMRLFDNPNADFSGPKENVKDLVTGELLEFNSASSEWAKLSWFTDFEELFMSELVPGTSPQHDKLMRVPVSSSLTNKTKIRVMANMHPNRVVLSVVGNPNVDYSDNRYLISNAYIGAVDSFKDSKMDTEGNFGIYTSSSSVAAIPAEAKEPTETFTGLNKDGEGNPLPASEKWKIYDQAPAKVEVANAPDPQMRAYMKLGLLPSINLTSIGSDGILPGETSFSTTYKKREIPANELIDSEGGRTGIVESSIRATMGFMQSVQGKNEIAFTFMYEFGSYNAGDYRNKHVWVNIPASDLKSSLIPVTTKYETKEGSLTEKVVLSIKTHDFYSFLHKHIEAELAAIGEASALIPKTLPCQLIRFSGGRHTTWNNTYQRPEGYVSVNNHDMLLGFDEQGEIRKVVNKSQRDRYGNLVKVNYAKTFGVNTANCSTDFAMYKTDSNDFWQSHYFMFSSTEPFMKKHMYGKSAYTNEYFADRIKITHSAEGVRGVLSGIIVIDAESLFAFDELIVNKEFNKDLNKPEETYVYLPITAAYSPFANSPNERNGIGLLKEVKYSEHDDKSKCEVALNELSKQYIDSLYYTNNREDVDLADMAHNGLKITWETSDPDIIVIQNTPAI